MKKLQYALFATGFFVCVLALLVEWEIIPSIPSYFSMPPENTEHRQEKSFVFIIPAFNCSDICERTLNSIFRQSYPNFRIIYIDDGSTDHTSSCVEHTITDPSQREKLTLKRFKKQRVQLKDFTKLYRNAVMTRSSSISKAILGSSLSTP